MARDGAEGGPPPLDRIDDVSGLPLVWSDGGIVAAATPVVTGIDHGLLMADGAFESLAVHLGRAGHLDRHLRRLRRALARLGIDGAPDDATLRDAIARLIDASGLAEARVRITVTSGPGPDARTRGDRPTTIVTIDRAADAPASVSLLTVEWPRNERSPFAGMKTLDWAENAHALRAARAAGFDNALFLDTQGRLSECATANIFLVLDGRIRTPTLDSGCLAGIVREVLLESGAASETDLRAGDVVRADGAFITTSTTGITPVRAIDDHRFPVDLVAFDRAREALEAMS